eukprot:SAG31_NODE_1756_length_7343_cov_2.790309_4_plen_103_part_00
MKDESAHGSGKSDCLAHCTCAIIAVSPLIKQLRTTLLSVRQLYIIIYILLYTVHTYLSVLRGRSPACMCLMYQYLEINSTLHSIWSDREWIDSTEATSKCPQ